VVQPDLNNREILLAATMAFFMAQVVWLLWRRARAWPASMTGPVALVALGFVVVNLVRVAIQLLYPTRNADFFHSGLVAAAAMVLYATLNLFLFISLVLMVTRRLTDELSAQEEKFAKAFHSAPYAVLLTRASDGTIFEVNDGFEEMTGFRRTEVLGKTTPELQIWHSEESRSEFVTRLAAQGRVRNVEMPFRRKSGEPLMGLVSAEMMNIGGERCVISCIGDNTEQSRLQEQLQTLASHDALTSLPNRRLFVDRFGVALANAARSQKKLALMSVDLDHFKEVNDRWGHAVGDAVLVEAAQRLKACLRGIDTVARFGGDEFVLLHWEVAGPLDAAAIAEKILERFRAPFLVGGTSLALGASLGIALYPDDGTDLEGLLARSDEALYEAKNNGRDGFRFSTTQ